VELRHLQYFLKITDTGGFTGAAAALRVTQPTLSHQIKQLEREVGAPLFDRFGRRIRLTEPGRVLESYARRALKEIDSGLNALAELDGLLRGKLALGVFRSFSSSLLPRVLAQYTRRYPGVRVAVRQLSLRDIERELVEGGLHMGIAYLPATSERVVTEPLFEVPLVLVANREHPLSGRRRVRVRELDGQPLVLLSEEYPLRRQIERSFARHRVNPNIVMEMNSNEAVLSTVRHGPLATILTARDVSSAGNLRVVGLADRGLRRTAAIFWSRDSHQPGAARAMAQMVKEAYAGRG
jgi:LysR family cyn operon transcriptional activator